MGRTIEIEEESGPKIIVTPPGPKAQELIKKDKKYISPSYIRPIPAVIERGKGVYVWDVDGNKYLDFSSGIAVVTTGHSHPEVVKAITEQANTLIHMSGTDFYYPPQTQLAEKLAEIVPGAKNKKVFFTNSGTESIEAALKLARYKTKRPLYIAFFGAFHGRTYGSLSLTASKPTHRRYFAPLLPQVVHVPYPDPYRTPFGVPPEKVTDTVLDYIESYVFRRVAPPEDVAAVFFEPIQGEGGYVFPPRDFFKRLQDLMKRYEILLVDDEIQAGMGRTGTMFAIEHWGIIPDMVAIAKGIASGLPLGALVTRSSLMDWERGSHATTFGGNPVACAAALKTIELLEDYLVENARTIGEFLLNGLKDIAERYEFLDYARGLGLMIGVEVVKDRETKEPDTERLNKVIFEAFKRGLILIPAGFCTIRFIPPLVITKREAEIGLEIFEEAIKASI